MRSSEPMPGNPWPHDMLISIDEPHSLVYLLFVREAWSLVVDDVPHIEPVPAVGASARPAGVDADAAADQWRHEWARAWAMFEPLDRAVREPDAETARLLKELSDEELAVATSPLPSDYWSTGIDGDAFGLWSAAIQDDHTVPLEQHPERVCLDALIPAWRTGLTRIVQLPFTGYFARRINSGTLVVSRATRHNADWYRRALRAPLEHLHW